MLDHLVFDTTDVTTMADTHNVGAYIRAADGTLIAKESINSVDRLAVDATLKDGSGTALTSTLVGGSKQALDVNIAAGLNVEVDLSHTDDSVRLGDGTSYFTSTSENSDIALDVHISNTSIAVTANDLDIRNLVAASDSVSSWTKDGSGNSIGSHTGSLDVYVANTISVNDAALANTAIANDANVLGTADTAEAIVSSALANRKYLFVYNNDNTKVFIGASTVTASNGFPVSPGSYLELRAGASVSPYFVGQTGKTPEVRYLELS